MVMDFGVLKRIVNEEIVSRFDHSLVLKASEAGEELYRVLSARFGNIITVDYQPTCENMLEDFAARISARPAPGCDAPLAAAARDGHLVCRVVRRRQHLTIKSPQTMKKLFLVDAYA